MFLLLSKSQDIAGKINTPDPFINLKSNGGMYYSPQLLLPFCCFSHCLSLYFPSLSLCLFHFLGSSVIDSSCSQYFFHCLLSLSLTLSFSVFSHIDFNLLIFNVAEGFYVSSSLNVQSVSFL